MIRDLVKIRCYVVLQESNCHGQLPYRLPDSAPCARETDFWLPAGFWLWNHTDSDFSFSTLSCCLFLVASFLLPHLVRFLARLGAFCSASYWLSLFPLGRLHGLGYWSSHWWCNVNDRRSRCRFVRIIFVKWADELSKVLDCWGWLPGIFFF